MNKIIFLVGVAALLVSCVSSHDGEEGGIGASDVRTSVDAAQYCADERSAADPLSFNGSMHCNTLTDRSMECDVSDWCFCQSASIGMSIEYPDLAVPAMEQVCWMCDRHGNLFDFWFINQTRGLNCDEGNL